MNRFFAAVLLGGIYFFFAVPLHSEVYWLGPKVGPRGKGKGVPQQSFEELLPQKKLMQEKVICNGVRTEVDISLLSGTLEDLLAELRGRYPDLKINVRRGGVLFSIPLGKKYQERVLLVEAEGKVTAFTMRLPRPMTSRPEWPQDLPLPPGAEVDEVVQFTGRGSVYAAFHGAEPGALNRVSTTLASYGFFSVTRESEQAGGRGELFMNAAKKQMMLLSIGQDGVGTMFLFPLAKETRQFMP